MATAYKYPRPALTVDCVVFGLDEASLKVLLIQRDLEPFEGMWALPGGFVRVDEDLDEAARRELREETGLERVFLEQLYTFGAPRRDPREHVVTVAYYALVKLMDHRVQAATDARNAAWFAVDELPTLAFDHADVLATALSRLRGKVRYQPIGFELLPPKFTLSQLQHLYEVILERPLDKRNFRKKVLSLELLEETDEVEQDVAHRAARLYRFDEKRYKKLVKQGLNFEI
jgi:8-oxo-dGTP diphosphatase